MTSPDIREIPLTGPGSGPYAITAGPDGALWLTLAGVGRRRPGSALDGAVRDLPHRPGRKADP